MDAASQKKGRAGKKEEGAKKKKPAGRGPFRAGWFRARLPALASSFHDPEELG